MDRLRESLSRRSARHEDRRFLDATMAASALVAFADGDVSFSEWIRLDQILEQLKQQRVFDVREAVNRFNDVVEKLQRKPEDGRNRALETIARFAGDADAARQMIRIACALSLADGDFSEREQQQVAELCSKLRVRPEECGIEDIVVPGTLEPKVSSS